MTTKFQLRRGTAAQWTAANPILSSGETGLETDTFRMKVGDGVTAWTSLRYGQGRQQAESAAITHSHFDWATAGVAPFQIQGNSFANTAGGAGTRNHGMWYGFNAARHAGGPGLVEGQMAWMMGIERDYYDAGGDERHGAEWYIQGFSPNGTTVQFRRPFYARGWCSDDGVYDWMTVFHEIGDDGLGSWAVHTVPGGPIPIYVDHVGTTITGYLNVTGVVTSNAGFIGNSGVNKDWYARANDPAGAVVFLSADTANVNLQITDAGNILTRAGTTFFGKTIEATATMKAAGFIGDSGANDDFVARSNNAAGSILFTNAAASANNLQITDAGNILTRAGSTLFAQTIEAAGIVKSPGFIGDSGVNDDFIARANTTSGSIVFFDATAANVNFQIDNAGNLYARNGATLQCTNTATGLKIGGSAAQKYAFWGATPVVRPSGKPADATDLPSAITLINHLAAAAVAIGIYS